MKHNTADNAANTADLIQDGDSLVSACYKYSGYSLTIETEEL